MNEPQDWVRETRIGTWFLSTGMWRQHVLPEAFQYIAEAFGTLPHDPVVLDIGCGEGFAFPFIDKMFRPKRLIGIDPNTALVRRASILGKACECPTDVVTGSADGMNLPDRSVDIVFCHQSFHHLVNQEAAAREFFRVLAPGGRLVFFESCRSFIFSWWIRLFFRHPMSEQKSADEYLDLLSEVGFEFSPRNVVKPFPPWSRPDFGILQALGRPVAREHNTPLVCVVARRP